VLRGPPRRGRFTKFLRALFNCQRTDKTGRSCAQTVLQLSISSALWPKNGLSGHKAVGGVTPRFSAWPNGITPFRQVLKVTRVDESGRFFDFFGRGGRPAHGCDLSPERTERVPLCRENGRESKQNHHDNIVGQFYGPVKVTIRGDMEE